MLTNKLLSVVKASVILGVMVTSLSACTAYIAPAGPNRGPYYAHPRQPWVAGHYNRFGYWVPGHWR